MSVEVITVLGKVVTIRHENLFNPLLLSSVVVSINLAVDDDDDTASNVEPTPSNAPVLGKVVTSVDIDLAINRPVAILLADVPNQFLELHLL